MGSVLMLSNQGSIWVLETNGPATRLFGSAYPLRNIDNGNNYYAQTGGTVFGQGAVFGEGQKWTVHDAVAGAPLDGSRIYYGAKVTFANPATGKFIGHSATLLIEATDLWTPRVWWSIEPQ